MEKINKMKVLFEILNEKPIVFHKIYSKITGGVTSGLLLSQLIYWDKQMGHKEFYKTDKDFYEELGMGKREFRNAKAKLKKLNLIKIKVKGIPAKTYYKVDINEIITLISTEKSSGKTSMAERGKLVWPKGANKNGLKGQTITESTTENTTEITSEMRGGLRPLDIFPKKSSSSIPNHSKKLNNLLDDKKNIFEETNEMELPKNRDGAIQTETIMRIFKKTNMALVLKNKTEREVIEKMIKSDGFEKIKILADFTIKSQGKEFYPQAITPLEFFRKLTKIKNKYDLGQQKEKKEENSLSKEKQEYYKSRSIVMDVDNEDKNDKGEYKNKDNKLII